MYPGEDTLGGVPLIRVGDIVDGRINPDPAFRIAPSVHHEYRRTALVGGECLITLVGRPGISVVVPPSMAGWNAARALAVVRLREPEETRYLTYALASPAVQNTIRNWCNTTVQATLNLKEIKALPVPWPDAVQRRNMVEILGSLDDKIELNRRMNATLEAMAQAIFRDWFVDFGPTRRKFDGATDPVAIMGGLVSDPDRARELADLFPAKLEDDGLPEGWGMRPFSDFVQIVGGGTPKTSVGAFWNGSIPWFSVVDTPAPGSVFVHETEKSITEAGVEASSARLIDAGTTIISARGTVGNLAMASRTMTFNQSCYGLKARNGAGDCFVFMASQHLVDRLKSMAHGSVFSTITRQTFESVQQCDPAPALFAAYEVLAGALFSKIKGNGQQNATLAATRDLLLPKLMSGEVRLSDTEAILEAAQ